jgi:AcrR family transcriptional regulator
VKATRSIPVRGIFSEQAHHRGKSERTRARLMDAAVAIIARDGVEGASANEIARAADVANGTFYLHFKDKNEVAAAVVFSIARAVAARLDEAMVDVADAVERTSQATRQFIEIASDDPEWGRALYGAMWSMPELRGQIVTYLRTDLRRGVRQGAFTVKVDSFLIGIFVSMTAASLFERLEGAGPEVGSKVAELQLRMLGVNATRAYDAAWRKLTPIKLRALERDEITLEVKGPRHRR